MKVALFLQSISDVITNSSSELFCTIFSDEHIDEIGELLFSLFGFENDAEIYPRVSVLHKDEESEWRDDLEGYPDTWVELELPYSLSELGTFFKAGLDAVLREHFNGLYKIVY